MIPKPDVVIVSGSREWSDRDAVANVLKPFRFKTILLHGDCRGLDLIAAHFGKVHGFQVWPFAYCEDENGVECRNESMCAVAAALRDWGHRVHPFGFPLKGSVGTWKWVRIMKRLGFDPKGPNGELL